MCVVRRRKRRKRPLSLNIDLTLLPFSLLCPSSSSWVNTAKGDKGREDGRGKGAMRGKTQPAGSVYYGSGGRGNKKGKRRSGEATAAVG